MPSLVFRALLAAVVTCAVVPPAAEAFTGTPAALALVRQMRAVYTRVPAVRWALSGAVVYCPSVPFEWTFAPMQGCSRAATITEEDNLRGGRVAVGVGSITVDSRPKVRYVISPAGFYAQVAGTSCWRLRLAPLQSPLFVSYPFPGERLAIIGRSNRQIVLQALASGYRELDYVDPKSFFELRQVNETLTPHKTYKAVYVAHKLAAPVSVPSTTPSCP